MYKPVPKRRNPHLVITVGGWHRTDAESEGYLKELRRELEQRNYLSGFYAAIEWDLVYTCPSCNRDLEFDREYRGCSGCGKIICEWCAYFEGVKYMCEECWLKT